MLVLADWAVHDYDLSGLSNTFRRRDEGILAALAGAAGGWFSGGAIERLPAAIGSRWASVLGFSCAGSTFQALRRSAECLPDGQITNQDGNCVSITPQSSL